MFRNIRVSEEPKMIRCHLCVSLLLHIPCVNDLLIGDCICINHYTIYVHQCKSWLQF